MAEDIVINLSANTQKFDDALTMSQKKTDALERKLISAAKLPTGFFQGLSLASGVAVKAFS